MKCVIWPQSGHILEYLFQQSLHVLILLRHRVLCIFSLVQHCVECVKLTGHFLLHICCRLFDNCSIAYRRLQFHFVQRVQSAIQCYGVGGSGWLELCARRRSSGGCGITFLLFRSDFQQIGQASANILDCVPNIVLSDRTL